MDIGRLMESTVMQVNVPESLMTQEISSQVLQKIPAGIFVFTHDWSLIFANDTALSDIDVSFEELQDFHWMNWLVVKNPKLNLRSLRKFLHLFWSKSIKNRRMNISINPDSHLVFLVSIKNIYIAEVKYRMIISRETTVEHKKTMRALKFYKSFRRDLRVAKVIQNTINNSIIDKIVGKDYIFHFYSKFMPSDELSGDLININQISRRYFSVFSGDGKGHGLPAALYSSLIGSYLNILALEVVSGEQDLASVINLVNQVAYKDFTKGGEYYFFSGVFLLVDGNENQFSIVNAGHPTPFYIDSNKKVNKVATHGPVIGVSQDVIYKKTNFEAEDGQVFFFYTDGLAEKLGENDELDSFTSLCRFFSKYAESHLNFDQFHDHIMQAKMDDMNEYHLKDDISILIMRVEKKR